MNYVEGVFKFLESKDKSTGAPTERETRRKGSLLMLNYLQEGAPARIEYKDGSGVLLTSNVQNISESSKDIIIETMNTLYRFEKVR